VLSLTSKAQGSSGTLATPCTVRHFEGKDLYAGAKLALEHRLYVPGWQLYKEFKGLLKRVPVDYAVLAIAFLGDLPVAVAYRRANSVQIFCRARHRRKGYGTKLIKHLSTLSPLVNPSLHEGARGSMEFWEACGMRVRYRR
jgi:GNAT superfamily N-acetyltransferase